MKTSIIKILLIGDYSIFRNALRMLLETDNRIRVVGEADRIDAASKIVSVEQPDLILVDLPDVREQDIIPSFQNFKPPVLVLISGYDVEVYKKCLQLGISGLILKEEHAETLFKAVDKICAGELWFDRTMMGETIKNLIEENQVQREQPKHDPSMSLTYREREVVKLLCAGKKTKDIASDLFIAENTVRHHLTSVFSKLEIKGRLELVIYAFKNGLAKLPKGNGSKKANGSTNGSGATRGNGRSKNYSQALNA